MLFRSVYELVSAGKLAVGATASQQINAAVYIGPNGLNISGQNAVVLGENAIQIVGPTVHNAPPAKYRRIEDSELRNFLSVGERVALRALEEEFGCEVRIGISIATAEGGMNPDAAVVCGEDVVGVLLYENKGNAIPYFQVKAFIERANTTKFERFQKFILYVAIVSALDQSLDGPMRARLTEIAKTANFDVQIRMYHLGNNNPHTN